VKIAGTILTRIVLMTSALAIVLLTTRNLGAGGQGTAGLFALGILLVQALSNFIGGGANVYLAPRMAPGQAFWPSVIWAVLSAGIFFSLFLIIPVVPDDLAVHACAIGLIQSVHMTLQQVTLARESIRTYNWILSTQAVIAAVLLTIFFEWAEWLSIYAYVSALYVAHCVALAGFALANRKWIAQASFIHFKTTWRELFRLGKFAQGGNVLHLLNQRLNLVFLENLWHTGRFAVGVYSIALYIAEAIWTVSKSLSVIQYARIANSEHDMEARALTRHYLKISLFVVTLSSALILVVPSNWYTILFSNDVADLQQTLLWLTPGILANGASIIYAHYFSGRGQHHQNMKASALGLILSVALALMLIPSFGIRGAAASTSAALVVQALWFGWKYRGRSLQSN